MSWGGAYNKRMITTTEANAMGHDRSWTRTTELMSEETKEILRGGHYEGREFRKGIMVPGQSRRLTKENLDLEDEAVVGAAESSVEVAD